MQAINTTFYSTAKIMMLEGKTIKEIADFLDVHPRDVIMAVKMWEGQNMLPVDEGV